MFFYFFTYFKNVCNCSGRHFYHDWFVTCSSNTFDHLSVDIHCLLLHTFLLLLLPASSNETWLCSYCVMRLWILRKSSVFTGFLWPCPSRGSSWGGRHHTSLLTRGGRSPGFLGPSLASEGGILISPGWRCEYRLTDKALGAASSLLGDGRRHNSLIHLCWHHLIAAGWGSNSRWEAEADNQRGGKTRQLSA